MGDDRLSKKLQKELQPELDRMRADHAQKGGIAEANSPEGWQKAIAEVIADGRPQHRKAKYWLLAGAIVVAVVGGVLAIFKLM